MSLWTPAKRVTIFGEDENMSDGLDVIVVDDDKGICEVISELVESFYSWGNVISFSNADSAIDHCLQRR
jgi:DNA-binding NtrC family response regulator